KSLTSPSKNNRTQLKIFAIFDPTSRCVGDPWRFEVTFHRETDCNEPGKSRESAVPSLARYFRSTVLAEVSRWMRCMLPAGRLSQGAKKRRARSSFVRRER